jgi:mono/diheme cytochrome c family protein
MVRNLSIAVLFATVLFAFNSCYYDNEEELYPATDTASVTYTKDIAPILQSRCNGCHSSGQSPNMGTYDNAKTLKDRIKARAVDANPSPMPPSGLIPASERDKITRWINAGTPN